MKETTMKTAIYTAEVISPFGSFIFAVDSTEYDAKSDVRTAAGGELRVHQGLLTVKNLKKSNRTVLKKMWPARGCQEWAWLRRI